MPNNLAASVADSSKESIGVFRFSLSLRLNNCYNANKALLFFLLKLHVYLRRGLFHLAALRSSPAN